MIDKQQALRDLLAKVEAGVARPHEVFNAFDTPCQDMALQQRAEDAKNAYKGSTDAALALHNSVLPEWDWRLEDNAQGYVCHIGPTREEFMPSIMAVGFESAARTFLTAVLKALIAKGETDA